MLPDLVTKYLGIVPFTGITEQINENRRYGMDIFISLLP